MKCAENTCGFLSAVSTHLSAFWEIVRPDIPEDPRDQSNSVIVVANCLRNCLKILAKNLLPDFTQDSNAFNQNGDLDYLMGPNRYGDRFLGRYSVDDIEKVIRNSALCQRLSDLGFNDWYVEIDLSDSFVHFAYLRDRSLPGKDQFLGFLIAQMGEYSFATKCQFVRQNLPANLDLVNVKWIALQNPKMRFTPEKPRLPVQKYPGTGLMKLAFTTLMDLAKKRGRDGVLNFPEHIHNAILYRDFRFVDPNDQGKFVRMAKDLWGDIQKRGLAVVSWAVYLGFLRCNGEVVRWEPREMICPLSRRMKSYFKGREYLRISKEAEQNSGPFYINWEEAERFYLPQLIGE